MGVISYLLLGLCLSVFVLGSSLFRRRAKAFYCRIFKAIGGETVPPFELLLAEEEEIEWLNHKSVLALSSEFESLDFTKVADYEIVNSADNTNIRVFHQVSSGFFAILYDCSFKNTFVQLFALQYDNSVISISSGPERGFADPSFHKRYYHTIHLSRYPSELRRIHQELVCKIKWSNLKFIHRDEFVSYCCGLYKKEMDWRIEVGGVSESEIICDAQLLGREYPSLKEIRNIQNLWRNAIAAEINRRCQEIFQQEVNWSQEEWDSKKNRLIFLNPHVGVAEIISELLPLVVANEKEIGDSFYCQTEEKWNKQCHDKTIFEAFEVLREVLPQSIHFKTVGKMHKPYLCEVHLSSVDLNQ